MAIKVVRGSGAVANLEDCEACFKCGLATAYWHEANDVACCPPCALKILSDTDVPTKEQWFADEEAKSKAKAKAFWLARIEANKTKKPVACPA